MPDTKITALTAIGANPIIPATFPIPMVDLTDTSMAASGTTKKVTVNQILGAGGTATLASATITGGLTVNGGVNLANATAINFGGLLTIYSDTAAGLFIRGRTVTGTTFQTQDGTNPLLNISNSGIFTFSDGAGGTRMTLNATGLGVGVSPATKFHVKGGLPVFRLDNSSTGLNQFDTGVDSLGAYFRTYVVDGIRWYNAAGGIPMTLDASGNLLVGSTALNATWNTRLTLSSDSGTTRWAVGPYSTATNFVISAASGGGVYLNGTAATSWTSASDERLKDIIEPISNAIAKVGSLRAVIGKFKSDDTNTRKSFLMAQDVQSVLPEAVDASNPDRLGLAYTDVIPLLVAAIKELAARVQTLETR